MEESTDRTSEVEQKLKAIHIGTRDCCSFWSERRDTLVQIRQCWYCAYASFDRSNPDVHQKGLCKYKQFSPERPGRVSPFVKGKRLTDNQLDMAAAGDYFQTDKGMKMCPRCGAVMNLEWTTNHGDMMQVYLCRSCMYKEEV